MNAHEKRVIKSVLLDLRAGFRDASILALEKLLPSPRRAPRSIGGTTLKEDREARRQTHREETAELRAEVVKRADGWCECQCGAPLLLTGQLDHMLSGSGRRREQQSKQTTWMLTPACHMAKTANAPSSAWWWAKFDAHCRVYDYPILNRGERAPLRAKAGP